MCKLRQLFCLFVVVSLSGCAITPQTPSVQHIVVVWLKDPGNEIHRQQLLSASQRLTEIPGIMSVNGGPVISSDRAVVDSSFDIALVIKMRDREVLSSYVQHPLHQQLLREVFKPLIEHYRVYDVEQPSLYQ